jgi:outer membrane protein
MAAGAAGLTVRLDNPPPEGMVVFVLFDSANTFGDLRAPVKVVKHTLDGRDFYDIRDIPPGEYALLVYYDVNNNDRIDRNFIGIPREPIGFSNGYQPKGPPSFNRAAFVLKEGMTRHFDVKLERPLGKLGRIGIGVGVIARSSPYRDYKGGVYQVIPAITYTGGRVQIYGPKVSVGLVGSGKLRLAATGSYRIGVYEENESVFLDGMGNRKSTLMAGLALQADLPGGVDISASYEHDVLDRIGGGTARFEIGKSFQYRVFRFSPEISVNWLGSTLSNHDFGVPAGKALPDRPAYDPGNTVSAEGGLGTFVEITKDWLVIMRTDIELLDDAVTDSPIVNDSYVIKGFGAITYVF